MTDLYRYLHHYRLMPVDDLINIQWHGAMGMNLYLHFIYLPRQIN